MDDLLQRFLALHKERVRKPHNKIQTVFEDDLESCWVFWIIRFVYSS